MKDIFTQVKDELSDFEETIEVSEPTDRNSLRFLSHSDDDYAFNQKDTINRIDRYYNSQFESGKLDSEGQRKTFLNIVKFSADVSAKQTDMDVKDFTFIPDTKHDVDGVWVLRRMFTIWSRENEYGKLLNDLNTDYSKYGTAVLKRVGKQLERVPLRNLKNTQDAESLKHAVESGGYVIQEHKLNKYQMSQFPDWNIDALTIDDDETITVYERHGLIKESEIDEDGGDEMVLAVAYVTYEGTQNGHHLLFAEQEDTLPFEEVHWAKQDGRWLGIGEVENQFENQVARNLTANLRRRNMLWGSKKIFQSADTDMVGKNLVKEVSDGEVLEVGAQGAINQVNTQTQHGVDFAQDDQVWDDNSRQKSFVFEVNTGESLPSGTPFRLGVILSNASQSHFNLKRENFGFFLERSFFNHLVPIFEKQSNRKEHTMAIATNEEGVDRFVNAMLTVNANNRLKKKILDKNLTRNLLDLEFNFEEELERVKEEIKEDPYFFLKIPKHFFTNLHFHMELTVTGEEINIEKKIETLATLFQALPPEDERRDQVLNRIISLTGMDTGSLLKTNGTENRTAQQGTEGNLSSLIANATGQGAEGLPQEAGTAPVGR